MGIDPATAMLAAGTVGAVASIGQGKTAKRQYEYESTQAMMEANAQITERQRALNEALSMQNAMLGAQGRTASSISSVVQGDISRFNADKEMIKAGGYSQSRQNIMAGKSAQNQGYMNAVSGIANTAMNYSLLK